jgi:hypothetical protein
MPEGGTNDSIILTTFNFGFLNNGKKNQRERESLTHRHVFNHYLEVS